MKDADYTSVRNGSHVQKLIDLKSSADKLSAGPLISVLSGPIEKALSISLVNKYYPHYLKRLDRNPDHPESCFQSALETINVRIRIDPQDLDRIPQKGPLVVVSNHPFGGIEGVILGKILLEARADVRILANFLLKNVAGSAILSFPWIPSKNVRQSGET